VATVYFACLRSQNLFRYRLHGCKQLLNQEDILLAPSDGVMYRMYVVVERCVGLTCRSDPMWRLITRSSECILIETCVKVKSDVAAVQTRQNAATIMETLTIMSQKPRNFTSTSRL
jgi:hypothetical protein